MPSPKIYTTAEWGAVPKSVKTSKPAAGILLHHMVYANRVPLTGDAERDKAFAIARRCQKDHLAQKWSDTGQHFTISRGGVILEGRHGSLAKAKLGKVVQAAHAGKGKGLFNNTWFGIENEGTYHLQLLMTDEQWDALVELCAWLSFWGAFDSQNIRGHGEITATQCPGLLQGKIDELRSAVHDRKVEIIASGGT
jgi:hypothetical protein